MTTTLPPKIAPRVVEHETGGREPAWKPPEQTVRGLLAGAEAAIGSWLVITVIVLAGYAATAAAPELGTASWLDAARIGSAIWLLGHGGALHLGGASITLIPLGVTLIGVVAAATSIGRSRPQGWWPIAMAITSYTAFAGGFAALAATSGSWHGVIGAPIVACLGTLVALRHQYPKGLQRLIDKVPAAVRLGVRVGFWVAALAVGIGLIGVVVSVVLSFGAIVELHRALVPDAVSSVLIVVAQVIALPTLAVWSTAFIAGPGFAIGQGTLFSPTVIDAGPLPVVPVLAALPQPGMPSLGLLVGVGIALGAGAAVWIRRRGLDLLPSLLAAAVGALTAALVLTAAAAASSGGIGPGRMAVIGPDAIAVGLAIVWQLGAGAVGLVLLSHPQTRTGLSNATDAVRRWWEQVRS